ncbi:MAG: hypothetical protein U9P80_05025 [Thermodesulfobacteriota bacterium]|nr:hypothetical protein [Thermodesulfobacteriota bacterium]
MLDIEAASVEKTGTLIKADGNVIIKARDAELRADHVIYDTALEDIWALGDCILSEKDAKLKGGSLYYNVITGDSDIEDGSIVVYSEPMRLSGESLKRQGDAFYLGKNVHYTPCLADPPAWSFSAAHLRVPLEGYASARHVMFRVHDIPVMYMPVLVYPAKLRRQSGLLFPFMGHSTDRGYFFGLPVYMVLGRSSDLTITPVFLSDRGTLISAQLRYCLDHDTRGLVYIEALRDKRSEDAMEGGILDARPDKRWFFKAKHRGGGLAWDINLVNSDDYFRDIGVFYEGQGDEQWETQNTDELDDLISRMQWTHSSGGFTANISGRWDQDLTTEDGKTIQQVPKLQARMSQKTIPFTPLKVSSQLSSVRLYSSDWVKGLRDYGDCEVSWPFGWNPYVTLRPYIKYMHRDIYLTSNMEYLDTADNEWKDSPFPKDVYSEVWQKRGVSLTNTLYSSRFYHGLYHQIVPLVSWTRFSRMGSNYDTSDPSHQRDAFPELLSEDDWNKTFDMNLCVSNYIRNSQGNAMAQLSLSRTYSYLTKEWGMAAATLRIDPADWISLEHTNTFGRASLHPYATHENSTSLKFKDPRGDELNLDMEYNRSSDTRSISGSARIELFSGFYLGIGAQYDYDAPDDRMKRRFEYMQQTIGYKSQCWGIELSGYVEPTDMIEVTMDDNTTCEKNVPRNTTISLKINLLGMGDVVHSNFSMDEDG